MQGCPSRQEQVKAANNARGYGKKAEGEDPENDDEEEADMLPVRKKPASRGQGCNSKSKAKPTVASAGSSRGRGRGRGRGGRGRGGSSKPQNSVPEMTPAPKSKSKTPAPDNEDMETPPKTKLKGKQPPKPAMTWAECDGGDETESNDAKPLKEAAGTTNKRQRHSDEDKSFARRARPKREEALNQWLAIRDAYNKDIHKNFGASKQD